MAEQRSTFEELKVTGEQLLKTVQQLLREGNIRRITLKNADGRTLLSIPLTAGIVGVVLLPFWSTLGALAAVASGYTLVVERAEETVRPSSTARDEQPPTAPH